MQVLKYLLFSPYDGYKADNTLVVFDKQSFFLIDSIIYDPSSRGSGIMALHIWNYPNLLARKPVK